MHTHQWQKHPDKFGYYCPCSQNFYSAEEYVVIGGCLFEIEREGEEEEDG